MAAERSHARIDRRRHHRLRDREAGRSVRHARDRDAEASGLRRDRARRTHLWPCRPRDFLAQCHALVIAAPLTPETHGLMGRAEFARLPVGAMVINVGRAKIVDTEALIAALKSGHLGGASLDVFPQEPLPAIIRCGRPRT